jgi:hypothetical protein
VPAPVLARSSRLHPRGLDGRQTPRQQAAGLGPASAGCPAGTWCPRPGGAQDRHLGPADLVHGFTNALVDNEAVSQLVVL